MAENLGIGLPPRRDRARFLQKGCLREIRVGTTALEGATDADAETSGISPRAARIFARAATDAHPPCSAARFVRQRTEVGLRDGYHRAKLD